MALWSETTTRGGLQACNFIKKDTLAQVFSFKFCEISKNTFFTEHLWTTASVAMCELVWKDSYAEIDFCKFFRK